MFIKVDIDTLLKGLSIREMEELKSKLLPKLHEAKLDALTDEEKKKLDSIRSPNMTDKGTYFTTKLQVIKVFRDRTGLSLLDSKTVVETYLEKGE